MTAVVSVEGLTKSFGPKRGIDGLSFDVTEGEIFGFLGPNGAGKSTTIRLLTGLCHPTSGRATVLGLDPQAGSVIIHRRIGYLPGELALYPRLTGQQHVDFIARVRGLRDLTFVRELVERFEVDLERPTRTLSKGTGRRSASSSP
ncbi:MAG: ABC transporter ATP-binding protein [Candidatus Dormibacteraeota bacterium]|nr:ABC transporter ATP-binding protein [Candidatus Dormibacteraeota bacterium]